MPTFPKLGKPDINLLWQYVFGNPKNGQSTGNKPDKQAGQPGHSSSSSSSNNSKAHESGS
jgi:hypothetical protein